MLYKAINLLLIYNMSTSTIKIIIRPIKFLDISQTILVNENNLSENYDKQFWIDKFYSGKKYSFVASWGKDIIGYILCDNEGIISFAINEQFRKQGIGRQLLYHCLNTIQKDITLNVRISNVNAIKLYESVGFIVKEKIIDYYENPTEDAFEMIRKYNKDIVYDVNKKINVKINK